MGDFVILKALQSFKDLTIQQAHSLLEIIKKQKVMTKAEIDKLLNSTSCCKGTSSYKIVAALVRKQVLFPVSGKKDAYEPMNPDMLLAQCSNAITKLETEIDGLIISDEWNKSDPRKKAKRFDEEWHIINELHKLKKDYTFDFFSDAKSKKMLFWDEIKSHFKINPKQGNYNCTIIKNKVKPDDVAIIILSKRPHKEGKISFYGNLIYDANLLKIFEKKRVKK